MRMMSQAEFDTLRSGATVVIDHPRDGLGVLRLGDGTFVKVFRHKKRLSTNSIRPYATRFCRNAARLQSLGIPTVKVIDSWRVSGLDRDAVHYKGLVGTPLRKALSDANLSDERHEQLMIELARLLSRLHEVGVYFRGLHHGNVFVLDDDTMGLIDISDIRFRHRPLSLRLRARNFKPPLRYKEDTAALNRFGVRRFVERYLEFADLNPVHVSKLLRLLTQQHEVLRHAIESLSGMPGAKAVK